MRTPLDHVIQLIREIQGSPGYDGPNDRGELGHIYRDAFVVYRAQWGAEDPVHVDDSQIPHLVAALNSKSLEFNRPLLDAARRVYANLQAAPAGR